MNRYVISFSKNGYIKYTSHLDLLRLFKRGLKKAAVPIDYSQGFNPHPKMVFAQPLSLGYTSDCELLEFETTKPINPEEVQQTMAELMPVGITIKECKVLNTQVKSLASAVETVEYNVVLPFPLTNATAAYEEMIASYLNQSEIIAQKKQKKTRKMVDVDIKSKIRFMEVAEGDNLTIKMILDGGSASNLSPELVISTFVAYANLDVMRYDIEVERKNFGFVKNLHF